MTKTIVSIRAEYVAISTVILYQSLLIVLIFLRPDLDPSWHTISEWVYGPYGWLMTTAFFVSAISYATLFIALKPHIKGILGKIGIFILFICFIGTLGVGLFKTDLMNTTHKTISTCGMFHIIFGSSALLLLPFAALIINLSLVYNNKVWYFARRVLLWSAFIPLIGFGGFILYTVNYVMPLGPEAYGPGVNIGWPPRFAFFSYMLWLILLALQALKASKENGRLK